MGLGEFDVSGDFRTIITAAFNESASPDNFGHNLQNNNDGPELAGRGAKMGMGAAEDNGLTEAGRGAKMGMGAAEGPSLTEVGRGMKM